MVTVSWRQACARRLQRHGLTAPQPALADAARAACGIHAQIMSAADLSLGLRVAGSTRADVASALWRDRTLVKTYGPRGTVHLLPTADLHTWSAALAAVPRRNNFPPGVKLDAGQHAEVIVAVAHALRDTELTVEELDAAVIEHCGAWAGELSMAAFGGFWPRWRQVISAPAASGALCFGPNRGRRVTYTGPRRWLPAARPVAARTALRALVRDYLHAYGPATPAHFAQWLAAPTPWARELFTEAEQIEFDGAAAWVNPGDTAFGDPARGVHLLPYFDAFVVGSHPRAALFPGYAAERALAGTQAGNFPVLLVDGVVCGVWHQKRSGKRIAVTVEPLRRLTAARLRELDRCVGHLGEILDGRAELTVGTVTVGPHA